MARMILLFLFWIRTILAQTGDCPDPPAIGNGFIISSGPYFNNTYASYTCQNGYSMSGRAYVRCAAAVWKGNTPTCNIVSNIQTTVNNGDDWVVAKWVLVGLAGLMGLLMMLLLVGACYYFCCRRDTDARTRVEPLNNNNHRYRSFHADEKKPIDKPEKKVTNKFDGTKKKKPRIAPRSTAALTNTRPPITGFAAPIGSKETPRREVMNSPPRSPPAPGEIKEEPPAKVSIQAQTDAPSFIAKSKKTQIAQVEAVAWSIPTKDPNKDHVAELLQDPPEALSPIGSIASFLPAPRSYSPNLSDRNKAQTTKAMWTKDESRRKGGANVWMPHANPVRNHFNTSTK
ncbi:hypothetical protein CAPTEDRAFT_204653 [Capitella teleta]|uniref:Sushi domain-containing protein n=1 Tax=Capitella teleta TaxID=283909 RepID=R7V6I6_CAPTE|nr:hypothetical protein CAPTEDRAFT_204653 [Capitella teleta]|eukprot:ELU14483.1 hypothetical protein CAPTEDRAFT_204653 [Capitella teleta]